MRVALSAMNRSSISPPRGRSAPYAIFFFFNDTATTEIYTLSLHDALPISASRGAPFQLDALGNDAVGGEPAIGAHDVAGPDRSEEHTSELQSPCNLVCRLLLEKKKKRSSLLRRVRADPEPV